jgi:hypothetical protein
VAVVPTGITLISYFFLYAAAQSAVMSLIRYNLVNRMAEGYFPVSFIWAYQIIAICVDLFVGFYLKKLQRIALYVFYGISILGLSFTGVTLGNINPLLQRMYEVMDMTPRIAEQDMIEMMMILIFLFSMAFNMVMVGYVYTKRKLFTK